MPPGWRRGRPRALADRPKWMVARKTFPKYSPSQNSILYTREQDIDYLGMDHDCQVINGWKSFSTYFTSNGRERLIFAFQRNVGSHKCFVDGGVTEAGLS